MFSNELLTVNFNVAHKSKINYLSPSPEGLFKVIKPDIGTPTFTDAKMFPSPEGLFKLIKPIAENQVSKTLSKPNLSKYPKSQEKAPHKKSQNQPKPIQNKADKATFEQQTTKPLFTNSFSDFFTKNLFPRLGSTKISKK